MNIWQQVDKGIFAAKYGDHLLEVRRNPDREDPRRYITIIDHKPTGEPAWNVSQAKTRAMNIVGANGRPTQPKAKRDATGPSWAAKIRPTVDPFDLIEKTARDLGVDLSASAEPAPEPAGYGEQPHVDKDQWLDSALGLDVKSADVGELSEQSRSNAGEMPETAPELPVDPELEAKLERAIQEERNALAHPEPAPAVQVEAPAAEGDQIVIKVSGNLTTCNTVAVLMQIEAALELLSEIGDLHCDIQLPLGIRTFGKKKPLNKSETP